MKIVIIAVLVLCILSGIVTAGTTTVNYAFNGDGNAEYPNEGYIIAYAYGVVPAYSGAGAGETAVSDAYDTNGNIMKYEYVATQTVSGLPACGSASDSYARAYNHNIQTSGYSYCYHTTHTGTYSYSCDYNRESSTNYGTIAHIGVYTASHPPTCGVTRYARCWSRVTITEGETYNITGTTACLDNIELYSDSVLLGVENFSSVDTYNFTNLIPGFNYTLVFSDSHEYEFKIVSSDVTYNYNACIQTHYNFVELCNNLIPDSEGFYIEKIGSTVHAASDFYTSSGIFNILESPADNIYISAKPFSGEIGWNLDPIVNDTTYTLVNPNIAWGLKVIVQNASDGAAINDAVVRVNQSCYCTDGYSIRQKKTVSGEVSYNDMSLQDASLWVYATGYKILDENTTGYDVFLSGRSNLSSKTWVVEMEPNSGNNTSGWYEVAYTTDIHFKDVNGNITSKILDTDAYVRLYYQNNNSAGESMTLKFQSSSTHTYFIDEQSWSIPHDESGYKEIVASYFTPWDYSYRATMYNSTIYGWNITIPLTVRNGTKETEQHYENLSTHLWFLNAADGKIDYREDMDIGVHACANNTTLMTINIEVYKDNVLLCYKNLTASDFINADFPYYYVYEPQYSYVSGSNYSVRMYGFDGTLLETDYVDCMTDTIIRKNKLTIQVKDRAGSPLTQSYIFLDGWGSLPTNGLSYNAYEGLEDGTYQYKASKSGYTTSGWSIINISGSDESVTYTLTSDTSVSALSSEKMTDEDIKDIFYPCMFFLFIIILVGGLMHVSR